MHNFVQFFYTGCRPDPGAPSRLCQPRAVDVPSAFKFRAEVANDLFIHRPARLHEFVRNRIRLDHVSTEFREHLADNRFPLAIPPVKPTLIW